MDILTSRRTASSMRATRGTIPRDCRIAKATRANLLLIGRQARAEEVVSALWPRTGLTTWRPGRRLWLPEEAETLILYDADCLWSGEQINLSQWLESRTGRTQIVTTSFGPLLARVEANAFLATLYYRLNTICVDLRELEDRFR
jgi:hypothetical protein